MEVWKSIKGYEDYQVSNYGNVKSLKYGKEKILSKGLDSSGYLLVCLCKDGKVKTFTIHQLVAVAFLNHTPNGCKIIIDHIDNDKLNNNIINLQLITHRQNASKDKKGCSSDYVGVSYNKQSNKWQSMMYLNGVNRYLGSFMKEHDAHLAYQEKLKSILTNK